MKVHVLIPLLIATAAITLAGCNGTETTSPEPTPTSPPPTPSPTPTPSLAAGQAEVGDTVRLHYTGTLGNGTVFDTSQQAGREPLDLIVGSGSVISGFDQAVRGMSTGEIKTVTLSPEEAYPYDDSLVQEVSREQFEEGLELVVGGTVYDAYGRPYTIVAVTETTATLDGNHYLAGKSLTFEIELLGIVQKRTYASAPSMVIDTSKEYVATIETEKGNLVLELYAEEAPVTVNNFVFLARDGFFDGTTFYRVLPDFMAQAGDPTGTSSYSPGYTIPYEDSGHTHVQGALSMANRDDPNSGSCHFFITYVASHDLDGGYTVFGQLVEGMDVLESLTARDPSTGPSYQGDEIIRITIEET